VLFILVYTSITRLASNEISSPSNKTHREVSRVEDLSAPRYCKFVSVLCRLTEHLNVPECTEHVALSPQCLLAN
jgi:hypothetical protein